MAKKNVITICFSGPWSRVPKGAPFVALDEEGEVITGHFSSSIGQAELDFVVNRGHHPRYDKRYPDGWEIDTRLKETVEEIRAELKSRQSK